jgi:hypothetical protein
MTGILVFLGAGASCPFGLPTMRDLVELFEQKLEKSKPIHITREYKIMVRLYRSIKKTLFNTYGYVDMESVFTVLLSISQRMKYSDLGFTSSFAISKFITDPNSSITTEENITAAGTLLRKYKTFVSSSCRLKNTQEKRITEVYSDFFEKLGSKYSISPITGKDEKKYIHPWSCSIYTTNYDAVMETYWEGITQINDLWKQEAGGKTLDVGKHEGDVLNLIKLHGSLDWFGLSDGTIVRMNRFQKTYSKREVQRGEFMIYPIQQKDLYLYPWFDLFWRFKDDLNHKKIWIVIGYRFNDEFILNMFVEALGRDHRLILVTPNAHDIVEKFSPGNVKKVSHRIRNGVDLRDNIVLVEKKFGGSDYKKVNEEIIGKLS